MFGGPAAACRQGGGGRLIGTTTKVAGTGHKVACGPASRPSGVRARPTFAPMKPAPTLSAPRNFFQDVHEVVRLIPAGRVSTYGAVAHYLGARHGARTVGYAMLAAHAVRPPVPAHRVVNHLGHLTGRLHFATPFAMQLALEAEGVRVEEDRVLDFGQRFWDPAAELG